MHLAWRKANHTKHLAKQIIYIYIYMCVCVCVCVCVRARARARARLILWNVWLNVAGFELGRNLFLH